VNTEESTGHTAKGIPAAQPPSARRIAAGGALDKGQKLTAPGTGLRLGDWLSTLERKFQFIILECQQPMPTPEEGAAKAKFNRVQRHEQRGLGGVSPSGVYDSALGRSRDGSRNMAPTTDTPTRATMHTTMHTQGKPVDQSIGCEERSMRAAWLELCIRQSDRILLVHEYSPQQNMQNIDQNHSPKHASGDYDDNVVDGTAGAGGLPKWGPEKTFRWQQLRRRRRRLLKHLWRRRTESVNPVNPLSCQHLLPISVQRLLLAAWQARRLPIELVSLHGRNTHSPRVHTKGGGGSSTMAPATSILCSNMSSPNNNLDASSGYRNREARPGPGAANSASWTAPSVLGQLDQFGRWLGGVQLGGSARPKNGKPIHKAPPAVGSSLSKPLLFPVSACHFVPHDFERHPRDMARLARVIAGLGVGLVLGGGGARGLAHLGVIRALEEYGIPVDMVGGTSIGSMIGGLFAQQPYDIGGLFQRAAYMSSEMSSMSNKLLDLTLPITSLFHGSYFNAGIRSCVGGEDVRIEGLRLGYFCITTDMRASTMGVHRSGPLWRYVRASMSLQGYLPPLAEPDGSMLLDGGYVNNLPADVMARLGARTIIAVDVSQAPETDYYQYGTSLSGWWLLLNRLNPFTATKTVPSMGEVSSALAYVCCEQNLRFHTEHRVHLSLRPPVNDYGTLEFAKHDEIVQKGYEYAKVHVSRWRQQAEKQGMWPQYLNHTLQPHIHN